MTKTFMARETVGSLKDVEVKLNLGKVYVRGPLGELERDFSHTLIDIRREDSELIIEAPWPDKKKAAMVGTVKSHITNMITGVLKGFTYKLKIIFAHFPITVRVQGTEIIIENFGGERKSRRARLQGDVKVVIESDEIHVKGINIEDVAQTAANIQQATRIKKKDPRIFLDGLYIFEKGEGM